LGRGTLPQEQAKGKKQMKTALKAAILTPAYITLCGVMASAMVYHSIRHARKLNQLSS
jgi:hypothetical protein